MVHKIILFFSLIVMPLVGQAYDPYTSKENRHLGFLFVRTPLPESDQISATHLGSGQVLTIRSSQLEHIPEGNYKLQVKLQKEVLSLDAKVMPTERTDIVVQGFGNLRVEAPEKSNLSLSDSQGKEIVDFDLNKTVTLPLGSYRLKGKVGKLKVNQDLQVFSNQTQVTTIR